MNQYWFAHRPISVIAPRMDKSCGRVADKFGLRTWTINLCTWIFGLTCLVFKTTYIDREKPLWESAFFFTSRTLFPPLDKRNTHDKAKGKAYRFGEVYRGLGVRCLSTLNRGQDSAATASNHDCFAHEPLQLRPPPQSCPYHLTYKLLFPLPQRQREAPAHRRHFVRERGLSRRVFA